MKILKIARNNNNIKTIIIPPQNGSVTHHQLQVITPTNFNTTNTIPRIPYIPVSLLLELLLIISIFSQIHNNYFYLSSNINFSDRILICGWSFIDS